MSESVVHLQQPEPKADPKAERASVSMSQIEGYIDAIEDARIFGWAWDRPNPSERLTVEVRHSGRVLTRVSADQPRPDLAANGIGDGKYAFAVEIDPALAANKDGLLQVMVGIAGQDCTTELRRQPTPEILVPPSAVLGEIRARDQRLQGQLKQLVAVSNDRRGVDQGLVERLKESLGKLDASLNDIDLRMGAVDVFQVRFETLLKDYEKRVESVEMKARGTTPIWLVAWAGVATLSTIGLVIRWMI